MARSSATGSALLLLFSACLLCAPGLVLGGKKPKPVVKVQEQKRVRGPYGSSSEAWPARIRRDPRGDPPSKPCSYTLFLTYEMANPDMGSARPLIKINGGTVGPTLYANVNDWLVVRVVNRAKAPAAMHWHGIHQANSPDMDGVPGVYRNVIQDGQSFEYRFQVTDVGTFWYHSHYKTQYMDSARGAIVVLDPKKDLKYRVHNAIMLQDHYYYDSNALLTPFMGSVNCNGQADLADPAMVDTPQLTACNSDGVEPVPNSCLIGGKGQCNPAKSETCAKKRPPVDTLDMFASYTAETSVPCSCDEGVAACRAKGGLTRIINGAGFGIFTLRVDDHLYSVVATDGVQTEPTPWLAEIKINVAQRYDLVMCRKTNPKSNAPAWIRVYMDDETFYEKSSNPTARAIWRYRDTPRALPTTTEWDAAWLGSAAGSSGMLGGNADVIDFYNLKPIDPNGPPDYTELIQLQIDFNEDADADWNVPDGTRAHFNGIFQRHYPMGEDGTGKPLTQLMQEWVRAGNLDDTTSDLYKEIQSRYEKMHMIDLNLNDVVEVVINNHDEGQHPLHLHGMNFWIMSRGEGDFSGTYVNADSRTMRDTATVQALGHIVIRFSANQVGIWPLHCHLEWHIASGLGLHFKVGEQLLPKANFLPAPTKRRLQHRSLRLRASSK